MLSSAAAYRAGDRHSGRLLTVGTPRRTPPRRHSSGPFSQTGRSEQSVDGDVQQWRSAVAALATIRILACCLVLRKRQVYSMRTMLVTRVDCAAGRHSRIPDSQPHITHQALRRNVAVERVPPCEVSRARGNICRFGILWTDDRARAFQLFTSEPSCNTPVRWTTRPSPDTTLTHSLETMRLLSSLSYHLAA